MATPLRIQCFWDAPDVRLWIWKYGHEQDRIEWIDFRRNPKTPLASDMQRCMESHISYLRLMALNVHPESTNAFPFPPPNWKLIKHISLFVFASGCAHWSLITIMSTDIIVHDPSMTDDNIKTHVSSWVIMVTPLRIECFWVCWLRMEYIPLSI